MRNAEGEEEVSERRATEKDVKVESKGKRG